MGKERKFVMENTIDNKKKLIQYLSFIRDKETEKPSNEIDADLVEACVVLLLELQGKKVTLSTEQIEDRVRKIPFVDTATFEAVNTKAKAKKLKHKKLLLIAAVVTILVTLLSIMSIAFEWNIFDDMRNRFGRVANAPADVELQVNNITFERLGNSISYTSIEDAVEQENIDILIPKKLPDGLSITLISVMEDNGQEEICVTFNDNFSYSAYTDTKMPDNIPYDEEMTINNKKCYIENLKDVGIVQIHFTYKDDYYFFTANDKQILLEIIENLEE